MVCLSPGIVAVPRISYEIEQADLKRFHLDEETTLRMLQADPYNSSTPAKTVLPSSRGIICDQSLSLTGKAQIQVGRIPELHY